MADGVRDGLLGTATPGAVGAAAAAAALDVDASDDTGNETKYNTIRNLVNPGFASEPWDDSQGGTNKREGQDQDEAQATAEEAERAAPDESSDEEDAAPSEETQEAPGEDEEGETVQASEEDDGPAIDPPRSWTKEEKEAFRALPHAHQQSIAERERARDVEIRRGQDEVANERKAIQSELQAAQQARQQYEQALPQVLQALNPQIQEIDTKLGSEFSDIKSWADADRMRAEDFVRYADWQALITRRDHMIHQQQAVQAEMQQSAAQRQQEAANQFQQFSKEENEKFLREAPEYADPQRAPQLQAQTREYLVDQGLSQPELEALWSGQSGISLRDHRTQMIIRDAVRWRNAQKAVKKPQKQAKPVPPVQKPGTASSKGERRQEHFKSLDTKLDKTHNRADAAALLLQRMRAS